MSRYIDADKVLYFFPDDMPQEMVGTDYAAGWNQCKRLCIASVEAVCDLGFIQEQSKSEPEKTEYSL